MAVFFLKCEQKSTQAQHTCIGARRTITIGKRQPEILKYLPIGNKHHATPFIHKITANVKKLRFEFITFLTGCRLIAVNLTINTRKIPWDFELKIFWSTHKWIIYDVLEDVRFEQICLAIICFVATHHQRRRSSYFGIYILYVTHSYVYAMVKCSCASAAKTTNLRLFSEVTINILNVFSEVLGNQNNIYLELFIMIYQVVPAYACLKITIL